MQIEDGRMQKIGIFDVGFISPNTVNEWLVRKAAEDTENNLITTNVPYTSKQKGNTLSLQLQVSVTILCIFGFAYARL